MSRLAQLSYGNGVREIGRRFHIRLPLPFQASGSTTSSAPIYIQVLYKAPYMTPYTNPFCLLLSY